MNHFIYAYCGFGVVVALVIYLVNRKISLIKGPSINNRLLEISLATCPLQGHWATPLVTGLAYALVVSGVVIGWPYALFVNIQRWLTYQSPMSDDEFKSEMRELRQRIENMKPMTSEEIETERTALNKLVANSKV